MQLKAACEKTSLELANAVSRMRGEEVKEAFGVPMAPKSAPAPAAATAGGGAATAPQPAMANAEPFDDDIPF